MNKLKNIARLLTLTGFLALTSNCKNAEITPTSVPMEVVTLPDQNQGVGCPNGESYFVPAVILIAAISAALAPP